VIIFLPTRDFPVSISPIFPGDGYVFDSSFGQIILLEFRNQELNGTLNAVPPESS